MMNQANLYDLERIRAAKGTTSAGLAIGITNVRGMNSSNVDSIVG